METFCQKNRGKRRCILSLYSEPPKHTISLEDLYKCTKQRYSLLQIIDDIHGCETSIRQEWLTAFVEKLTSDESDLLEFRRIILSDWEDNEFSHLTEWDIVSHYLLRTISSRLYESIRWFLKQEVKLLFVRWYLLNDKQRQYFVRKSKIVLNEVTPEERIELYRIFMDQNLINDLYKTRFTKVSQLFKTRTVYLRRGWVYFKFYQAVFLIANHYERYLKCSCESAKSKYHKLPFDERMTFFFRRLSDEIKQKFFKFSPPDSGKVKISDLKELSLNSFPLCMEILHYYLLKNCHLRNEGRFQYTLFLKGIGLSLHDSINFWRNILTKKMSIEMFTRYYLYHIRHNYGKLGKLANYPPLNCNRILDATPGPLDHHGCPFKTTQKDVLTLHLKRNRLADEDIEGIWNLVKENVPRQACARLFEVKHRVSSQHATSHPNIYFNKSRQLIEKRDSARENGLSTSKPNQACTSHCGQKQLEW